MIPKRLSWISEARSLLQGRAPAQLVLQFTDACNAHCPQCGMRASANFSRSRLQVEQGKRMITRAARSGVRALSLTGGEPFLYQDDLFTLLDHAGREGIPYLRTGTNGFLFRDSDREDFPAHIETFVCRLVASPLRNFWISLDSASLEVHEEMRGLPGVVEGIRKALPLFHRQGLYPAANLGLNRNLPGSDEPTDKKAFDSWYEDGLRRFFEMAIDLGFTTINFCYPMSSEDATDGEDSLYQATSADRVVRFTVEERKSIYRALFRVIPDYRKRIRIFTPRSALYRLVKGQEGAGTDYPCRGGIDFFFASADSGRVYPCGYRSDEDFGPLEEFSLPARSEAHCTRCDWECFRDPSETLGPLLQWKNPVGLWRSWKQDPDFFSLWWEDLRYYQACGWFSGRKAPEKPRLQAFHRLFPVTGGMDLPAHPEPPVQPSV